MDRGARHCTLPLRGLPIVARGDPCLNGLIFLMLSRFVVVAFNWMVTVPLVWTCSIGNGPVARSAICGGFSASLSISSPTV
jgi:hypothetical protein